MKIRWVLALSALLVCGSVLAQEKSSPAPDAPGEMTDMCLKHCREMAAAHQKTMAEHKAMMDRRDAAWKEIRAGIDAAKKAKGEKKVLALQDALDKLVAFHEDMMKTTASGSTEGMMGHGMRHGMGMRMERKNGCPGMMEDCGGGMRMSECPCAGRAPKEESKE